ncbi:MAG: hypothetical protein ABIH89_08515, partial [Elusimicrobiota bacterium]
MKIIIRLVILFGVFMIFYNGAPLAGGITIFLYLFFELLLHLHNIELTKKTEEQKKKFTGMKKKEENINRVFDAYIGENGVSKGYMGLDGLIRAG